MVRLRFSLVRTGAIVSLLFESRGSLVLGALPKEASSQPPVTVSSWGRWGSKGEGAADGDDAVFCPQSNYMVEMTVYDQTPNGGTL